MSLTGNLEDLPLLDILQIVSFSKKTGFLGINAPQGDGAIVFKEGFVVSSFTWDSIPLDTRAASLPPEKRATLIRTRIEIALEQLIRLREGQFSFNLTEGPPATIGLRDLSLETLPQGIDPQELLLDLARGMDEDRRTSSATVEASFARPADPFGERAATPTGDPSIAAAAKDAALPVMPEEPSVPPAPVHAAPEPGATVGRPGPAEEPPRTVLLVDDEEDVRRILSECLTQSGYQVVEAEDPDEAVKKGGRLGKVGIPFLLVTDLGMPTSGGSSFQGGFEVVKRLGKMNLKPPVLIMTESMNAAFQARAKQMGVSGIVFKPGLSKLDHEQFEADLRAFAARILRDLLPGLARPEPPGRAPSAEDPIAELPPVATPPVADELTHQFAMLQRRLEELRRPGDATQISLLVMKVAREFFERGILFIVKNEEVRGLGGFGLAPKEQHINLLVREVVIPLSEPSIFRDVVSGPRSYAGTLNDGKWGNYLLGKIGRFQSKAVALLPLLAQRETIAVLFGDNPETGRDFGRLEALEVFVTQAGVALEKAFLQRKVEALQKD